MTKINHKVKGKHKQSSPEIKTVPKNLTEIHFDDTEAWLKAYRSYNAQVVARAVIMAFRRRYFMSQKAAGEKIGVATNTINKWERGLATIRWKSRSDLVRSGWFKPQHFGLDASSDEFEDGEDEIRA